MRASVFIGTSLDGFIARANANFDFLPAEPEEHGYEAFFASVDALVIGRGTFETVLAFPTWPYGESASSSSAAGRSISRRSEAASSTRCPAIRARSSRSSTRRE